MTWTTAPSPVWPGPSMTGRIFSMPCSMVMPRELATQSVEGHGELGYRWPAGAATDLVGRVGLEDEASAGSERTGDGGVHAGSNRRRRVREHRDDEVPPVVTQVEVGQVGDDRGELDASVVGQAGGLRQTRRG